MFHPFRTLSYGANDKGSVWLTLDCDADASLGRVISAAQMAVDAWRENKKDEDAPIATGNIGRALRSAKAVLEERGISIKQLDLNRRWLVKAATYLEARSKPIERDPLLSFIRSTDINSRNRRNATTAALSKR